MTVSRSNVLVIGDVIIDRYTIGRRRGLSAETPTIVAELDNEQVYVGGAGLVCRHLSRLGCDVSLATVGAIAGDHDLLDLLSAENRINLNQMHLLGWRFSEKQRFFVEGYKLFQLDSLNKGIYSKDEEEEFISRILTNIDRSDAVVVADNGHGVLTKKIAASIVSESRKRKKPLFVDSQVSQGRSNHVWYTGADVFFMNQNELKSLYAQEGVETYSNHREPSSLTWVRNFLEAKIIAYKMGADGCIWQSEAEMTRIPGKIVDAVDTCGAGDAFLAAYVATRDFEKANSWAALSTVREGTYVPHQEDHYEVFGETL